MARIRWFVFDIGNVLIKLAYERVLERICAESICDRDTLVLWMEEPGAYRDLERGEVSFQEFYESLRSRFGFRGDQRAFRTIWGDFFDGPIEGMEELLDRVRSKYRVAFLSNSNEVHEEVIPRQYSVFFRKGEPLILSHRLRTAKPDLGVFQHCLRVIKARPEEVVYVDDLLENVSAALQLGIRGFQFHSAWQLTRELEADGLLSSE